MAGEKESSSTTTKLKTRIRQKHDTETNWLKATTFVPLDGELIIYDVDDTHSTPRFKVGDGIQVVGDLPFLADGINSQYLRNNYIPIKEITSGSFIVPQIGYNKEIYWLNSDVSVVEQSLAQRYTDGRLRVGDPVENNDAVNLQYLNNHFVAGAGISINKKTDEEKVEIKTEFIAGNARFEAVSGTGTIPQLSLYGFYSETAETAVPPWCRYGLSSIKYKPAGVGVSPIELSFGKSGTILTNNSVKTINGNSIVGSGDITISGGSGDVTAAGDNTFTGSNIFNKTVTINGNSQSLILKSGNDVTGLDCQVKISNNGDIIYNPAASSLTYTIALPTSSGTLMTNTDVISYVASQTSDSAKLSSENTFTGLNTFEGITSISGLSVGTMWASPHSASTQYAITLPAKAGTVALTSDVKIKSASLDGTTLTLTI